MKKAPKFISENIEKMQCGMHIHRAGCEYWINPIANPDIVLWISEDRAIAGATNGYEYARIIDGVAYLA